MHTRKEIVPNNLKEHRIRCGYTQKEVATILGFATEERICLWEKGKNIPNLINLLKLASLYRASPMQLYPELMMEVDDKIEDRVTSKIASTKDG
jgi:DNA-binding XRE family transcriptional regulator